MTRTEINVATGEIKIIEISQAELQEEINKNSLRIAAIPYTEKRLAEYPPISDYLDGIVKGDQEQINTYINKCLEIKNKYPKVAQGLV
jgi:hypothetical protein